MRTGAAGRIRSQLPFTRGARCETGTDVCSHFRSAASQPHCHPLSVAGASDVAIVQRRRAFELHRLALLLRRVSAVTTLCLGEQLLAWATCLHGRLGVGGSVEEWADQVVWCGVAAALIANRRKWTTSADGGGSHPGSIASSRCQSTELERRRAVLDRTAIECIAG